MAKVYHPALGRARMDREPTLEAAGCSANRWRRAAVALLACAGVAGAGAGPVSSAAAAECAGASGRPSQVSTATLEEATLCLMNGERAGRGLRPLRRSSKLERAAHKHTLDMLRSNLFSHSGSNGSTPYERIRKAGYLKGTKDWLVGENIAYGEEQLGAPSQIVEGWMESAPHRHNILGKRFRDVGISVEHGAPGASGSRSTTYTTDFGRRK